ncbi:MAG TPA: exodeoxyribonuclease V subunit alpha [Chthoniobacteraceae bacterium]|nr:exodeoxyribonuclease V subunit alpha [Chthoniobacteraceae bacterium]
MKLPVLPGQREFADIDRHFAKWLASFGGSEQAGMIAAALSRNLRLGHICLDLGDGPADFGTENDFPWPPTEALLAALKKNRAVGAPGDDRPLVLDPAGRLYLRRYWEYEESLACAILGRCDGNAPVKPAGGDMQQLAIETALARRFVVISGGPGTGKTTTVLKILEQMIARPGGAQLRIALAAPTGKAAARLEETLRGGNERLPKTASTLHRLLGARPGSAAMRYHAGNPLPVDVMVVDEASMVPLTMMAKLFDALPAKARVILLGDSHQLASVEPGYVLGDIAAAASTEGSPLRGSLVTLEKNHRFGSRSAIFALSSAVRDGDMPRAFEILGAPRQPDLVSAATPALSQMTQALKPRVIAGYSACLKESDPGEALKKFQQFRVLCALRAGPYGAEALNRKIEALLREEGLVSDTRPVRGMPLLVRRNDPALRLFNGDTGMLLPSESGAVMAWFMDDHGGVRAVAPGRLPEWEPAFAMTVHQSQGSEYNDVLLVLPPVPNPVCTRELVYTGLTRARERVEVWFREPVLNAAIASPMRRASGLRERLGGR